MSSFSRATAAAALAVNILGRPSRSVPSSWSVAPRSISSRTRNQTREEILELEKWKQSELEKMSMVDKTLAPSTTTTTAAKTTPVTNIQKPDALSTTTSAQTTTKDSKKRTDREPVAPVTTTTTNVKKSPANPSTTTTNSPPSVFRLTPGPPYDPLDPDNNMGVDHSAWIRRQLPLFLGGGPFF